jgi:hypothetical protein
MKRIAVIAALLLWSAIATAEPAANWAWLLSIPSARSAEQVYKIRVLSIDGAPQQELIRYPVTGGAHTLELQLLLDLEWEPDLTEGQHGLPVKELKLETEVGRTYLLAGRVDPDAPAESQLDQSFWQPVVYAVQ